MMDPSAMEGDKRDVRRPMNAFLIFCKRHRSIVREKNPDLDNRSVTRILGDLWANLKDHEKAVYTDLAKQYKDAFMKANPDYKWHNPEKTTANQKPGLGKPTNMKVLKTEMDLLPEGSIMPGKLADPSNMGGLSLLLMAGQHSDTEARPTEVPSSTSLADHYGGPTILDSDKIHVTKFTELSSHENTVCDLPKKENAAGVNGDTNTGLVGGGECEAGKPGCKVTNGGKPVKVAAEPVWKIDGKLIENQTKRDMPQQTAVLEGQHSKDLINYSLLELAEMCSNQLGPNKPAAPLKYGDLSTKPLLRQAIAAPKVPHRSLLTEAFMDTCDKGNYPEILRDKSAGSKSKQSLENQLKSCEQSLEKSVDHGPDEKENISKLIVTEVKDTQENSEDESSMIKCGKLVVNHIIDKLFSSDIATAVKKASENNNSDQISDTNVIAKREVESEDVFNAADNREDSKDDVKVKEPLSPECSEPLSEDIYDEHDGCKENEIEPAEDKKTVEDAKKEVSDTRDDSLETETLTNSENKLKDEKQDLTRLKDRKRLYFPPPISRESEGGEADGEETEEFHPVRKSRRRNRGQRYQELINEGIIQPSKERMAALQQHPATDDGGEEEDFQTIDTYILPETAIRRIRKRTTSESAKDKMVQMEDAKRYKTGDFDLEAHIATLPACSVEAMGRKRGFIRQRHSSECSHVKKSPDDHPLPVFDIEKTVSLPPHVKLPSPEKTTEPVVGSRKRKARKHSINHLLPAPPSIFNSASNSKPRMYESGATEGIGCHGNIEYENSHNKSEEIVNQDIKQETEGFVDTQHVLNGSDKKSEGNSVDSKDKFDNNKNRLLGDRSCSGDKGSLPGSVTDFKCKQSCGAETEDVFARGKSDLLENQSIVRSVSDPRTVHQNKEGDSQEPVSDDVMHEIGRSKTDVGSTGDTNSHTADVKVVEMDTVSGVGRPCGSDLVVCSSPGLDPNGLKPDTVVESGIPV